MPTMMRKVVVFKCKVCGAKWSEGFMMPARIDMDHRHILCICEGCEDLDEDIELLSRLWDQWVADELDWEDRHGKRVKAVNFLGSIESHKQSFLRVAARNMR